MGKRERTNEVSSSNSPKKAKKSSKFWKKQVKSIFKNANSSATKLKFKPIRKELVKAYRKENPSVSKDEAKEICLTEIKKLASYRLDGKYIIKMSKSSNNEESSNNNNNNTVVVASAESANGFPDIEDMDTKSYREKVELTLEGNGHEDAKFYPWQSLTKAEKAFGSNIMSVCKGFTKPTPIQAQCWPVLASGRDIVGIAETGSGKTLGFLLPAVWQVLNDKKIKDLNKPRILVVAPTRELAMQTNVVANEMPLKNVCIYGGVPKRDQFRALNNGIAVVIGTPGRLLDLAENTDALDLSNVSQLILDEADRMLDQGFEKDMRRLIGLCNKQRQTSLFSATWPESIRKLASEFMNNPVNVYIGSKDLTANVRVSQTIEVIEPRAKEKRLLQLLQKYHKSRKNRVLCFALYKKEAERLESMLSRNGWNCIAIHGNKTQEARTSALKQFKDGEIPLLIATDVAARGLDIPNVECVINVSFPLTIEDYIHRIGRTGRAGKFGISHTFFTNFDKARSGELQNVLREANQPIPDALLKFGSTVKRKEHKTYGRFGPKEDLVGLKAKKTTFSDSDSD
jgi:ATP-dependent RNA helicase DBP3